MNYSFFYSSIKISQMGPLIYKYKLQWWWNIKLNTNQQVKDVNAVVKILGIRSLDVILFRDSAGKIINRYTDFVSYPQTEALVRTKKHIKEMCKKPEVTYVELLRA